MISTPEGKMTDVKPTTGKADAELKATADVHGLQYGDEGDGALVPAYVGEQPEPGWAQRVVPLSWWQWRRTSLAQMLILSCLAFCGPAMGDAISNLGGGGLASPEAFLAASASQYAIMAVLCFVGGLLITRFGVVPVAIVGSACFPFDGSSLYVNSKGNGNTAYLIAGESIAGVGNALWYVVESCLVLSLPEAGHRGKYLALWIVSRNLGQLVGGAINLAVNVQNSESGSVSPSVYIVFMIIECIGFPLAFLLTDPKNVIRSDGTTIKTQTHRGWKQETRLLIQAACSPFLLLMLPLSFYSFFYISVYSRYLTDYFTVRARALSSLISPTFCIVGCFALGAVLDFQRWSQRTRAYAGAAIVFVSATALSVWSLIIQVQFDRNHQTPLDWTDAKWPKGFLNYFFIQTFGPIGQSYAYWLLSCRASDVQSNARMGGVFRSAEAVGQAVSYGIMSRNNVSMLAGFIVNTALMVAAFLPTLWSCSQVPRNEATLTGNQSEEGYEVKDAEEQEERTERF